MNSFLSPTKARKWASSSNSAKVMLPLHLLSRLNLKKKRSLSVVKVQIKPEQWNQLRDLKTTINSLTAMPWCYNYLVWIFSSNLRRWIWFWPIRPRKMKLLTLLILLTDLSSREHLNRWWEFTIRRSPSSLGLNLFPFSSMTKKRTSCTPLHLETKMSWNMNWIRDERSQKMTWNWASSMP